MTYKGYTGILAVDEDSNHLHGHVVGLTRDGITFHGKTVQEARECFERSVDFYLEMSAENGIEPERPDPAAVAAAVAAVELAHAS